MHLRAKMMPEEGDKKIPKRENRGKGGKREKTRNINVEIFSLQ